MVEYLIAVVTIAAAITLVWSAADRRRTEYTRLERWLRVYSRHALALVAMVYAMAKVVPTQFGYLTPGELLRPFGRLTGFSVVWDFMAASPAYTVFAGLVELIGAVLLFFPTTTLIGALILAGALTNVFVMDLAYGVGTAPTIIAGLLLALDAIVLAPYAGPLLRTLLGRQTAPLPAEPVSQGGRWRYGTLVKVVAVTLLVWQRAAAGMLQRQTYYGAGYSVYGLFDVDSFVRNGTPVVALANDAVTWKRVASDGRYNSSGLTVHFANGDVRQYRLTDDPETRVWTLAEASKDIATLRYEIESDASVALDGRIGDDSVQLRLKRVDLKTLPLFRSR